MQTEFVLHTSKGIDEVLRGIRMITFLPDRFKYIFYLDDLNILSHTFYGEVTNDSFTLVPTAAGKNIFTPLAAGRVDSLSDGSTVRISLKKSPPLQLFYIAIWFFALTLLPLLVSGAAKNNIAFLLNYVGFIIIYSIVIETLRRRELKKFLSKQFLILVSGLDSLPES